MLGSDGMNRSQKILDRGVHAVAAIDNAAGAQPAHNLSLALAGGDADHRRLRGFAVAQMQQAVLMLVGHIINLDIMQRAPGNSRLQNHPGTGGVDVDFQKLVAAGQDQRFAKRLQNRLGAGHCLTAGTDNKLGAVRVGNLTMCMRNRLQTLGKVRFRRRINTVDAVKAAGKKRD